MNKALKITFGWFCFLLFSAIYYLLSARTSLALIETPIGQSPQQQPQSGGNLAGLNPLGTLNLMDILTRIIQWLVGITIPIVAVMIIIGGYQIMFAGGSPDKVSSGRKTITYALAGLAVILLSYSAIALLKYFLGVQ